MKHIRTALLAAAIAHSLAACGGGGGGDSAPTGGVAPTPVDNKPGPSNPTPAPGKYVGSFYYSGDNRSIYKINLETGVQAKVYDSNTSPANAAEADAALNFATLADGVLAVTYSVRDPVSLDMRYFSKRYGDNAAGGELLFPEQVDGESKGRPLPSPNGQFLMLDWRKPGFENVDAAKTMRIFNATGQMLAEYSRPALSAWLPDNRPVFIDIDGAIYTADAGFNKLDRLGVVPNGAVPTALAPSPDGRKLAMVMNGNVWTSNLDGSNAVQVTDVTETKFDVRAPRWSPDGRYIAFSYRKAPSVIGWGAGCYAAWIVPAAVTTRVDAYGDGNDNVVLDAQGRPLCVSWELPFGQFVFIDWK